MSFFQPDPDSADLALTGWSISGIAPTIFLIHGAVPYLLGPKQKTGFFCAGSSERSCQKKTPPESCMEAEKRMYVCMYVRRSRFMLSPFELLNSYIVPMVRFNEITPSESLRLAEFLRRLRSLV